MAYVVAKPRGRYEVRESINTERGPRATTLASFAVLDDEVLALVAERARTPVDVDGLRRSARRVGAPVASSRVEQAARELLGLLADGHELAPGLTALLRAALGSGRSERPGGVGNDLAHWVAASDEERSHALVDLLGLADALPARRRGALAMPRLVPGTPRG